MCGSHLTEPVHKDERITENVRSDDTVKESTPGLHEGRGSTCRRTMFSLIDLELGITYERAVWMSRLSIGSTERPSTEESGFTDDTDFLK